MQNNNFLKIPTREELESVCVVCCDKAVTVQDYHNNLYCEKHQYRAEMMNWGHENNYPSVSCEPLAFFAIGAGEYCWRMAVLLGPEDALMTAYRVLQGQQVNEQAKGA